MNLYTVKYLDLESGTIERIKVRGTDAGHARRWALEAFKGSARIIAVF